MFEIKKIIDNPPSGLQKKIICLSVSKIWNEAITEWKMVNYYYVSEYRACSCSPRGIRNICVMVNCLNSNKVEICNSCAERYFDIYKCTEIEFMVRKLRKNIDYSVNIYALDYLLENKVINVIEYENYWNTIRCQISEWHREAKRQINIKLLNLTDYRNKEAIEKIDIILAWANMHCDWSLDYLATTRINLLSSGVADMEYLDGVIRKEQIDIGRYGYKEIEAGRQLLWKYYRTISLKQTLPPKYYKKRCLAYKKAVGKRYDGDKSVLKMTIFRNLDIDNLNNPILEYISEDTMRKIAQFISSWTYHISGVQEPPIHILLACVEMPAIMSIYRKNCGMTKYSDFVELLSMKELKSLLQRLMEKTYNIAVKKLAMNWLNDTFKQDGIIVEFHGDFLMFKNVEQ